MKSLTVDEMLDKGIGDETNLSEQEWPIFAVAYLESIADMEGWDHFFYIQYGIVSSSLKGSKACR